jgi:hypothetical protein
VSTVSNDQLGVDGLDSGTVDTQIVEAESGDG